MARSQSLGVVEGENDVPEYEKKMMRSQEKSISRGHAQIHVFEIRCWRSD